MGFIVSGQHVTLRRVVKQLQTGIGRRFVVAAKFAISLAQSRRSQDSKTAKVAWLKLLLPASIITVAGHFQFSIFNFQFACRRVARMEVWGRAVPTPSLLG